MLAKKDSHMSLCAEANKRNRTTLLIFFMTAAPLTLYWRERRNESRKFGSDGRRGWCCDGRAVLRVLVRRTGQLCR